MLVIQILSLIIVLAFFCLTHICGQIRKLSQPKQITTKENTTRGTCNFVQQIMTTLCYQFNWRYVIMALCRIVQSFVRRSLCDCTTRQVRESNEAPRTRRHRGRPEKKKLFFQINLIFNFDYSCHSSMRFLFLKTLKHPHYFPAIAFYCMDGVFSD